MRNVKILIILIIFIIATQISYSFQANSSNYKLFPLIVSSGGEISNSSNYKNYVAIGIIAGVINSSTYKNCLGFYCTWLLADGQQCTANNQCEGSFCCSNLCQNSECPTDDVVPSPGPSVVGGGGGGGAARVSNFSREKILKDFIVNPSSVKSKLKLGEFSEEILTIEYNGKPDLNISLTIEGINEYLSLSNYFFSLDQGQLVQVTLNFVGKRVGIFLGQVIALADGIEKSIPIILEVISKVILFDVKLDILNTIVEQGDVLKTQITLINVGAPENVNVLVEYFIKDLHGNVLYEEEETFAVENQISYQKTFDIDEKFELGIYVAIIEVRYVDSFAVSSQFFEVSERKWIKVQKIIKSTSTMLLLAFILVGFLALLVYKLLPVKKKRK